MAKNSVKILSLDGKDIYLANHYKKYNKLNKTNGHKEILGYNIRYEDGTINTKKFINDLDYSLDLIKLKEVYQKVYRRSDATFFIEDKEYSQSVINVTFQYSNKEFNRVSKNIYVRFGYDIKQIEFQDHICMENNTLIAIQVDLPFSSSIKEEQLPKYFSIEDGMYRCTGTIPTLHNVSTIREMIYEDGFYCDGIKYIRWKRSSGSSRVGKCLFIDEKLYSRMHRYEMCGLYVRKGQPIDLAALEAYIALPLSSIIDTRIIKKEEILLIDDYESIYTDEVMATTVDEKGWLRSTPIEANLSNSIWDGQSLLDRSLFESYERYGMLLLRNRFFKSCCFHTDIQKFFNDHNITHIDQLNGTTLATDIAQIKLITTPSSIKYLKFGTFHQWLDQLDTIFGIVKHDKPTHFYNGRMVQTHYQLLNTLELSTEEVESLLQPSLDYLTLLKTDPSVLRYHIKHPIQHNGTFTLTPTLTKNDIVFKLLGLNDDFTKTKLYQDFKKDLTQSFVRQLRSGNLLIRGNYSTLFGNPYEMLLQSIGTFDGTSHLGLGNVHTKNFAYDSVILGSRSPHITMGNIWLPKNVASPMIDRYFHLSKEIVCMNSIGENVLERLNGADFDSDTVLLTDHKLLIEAAKRHYHHFLVPTSMVDAKKVNRKYTNEEKADLDLKTSKNLIGEIVNLSQELNTILWNRIYHGSTIGEVQAIYSDIAKLAVMSGIEIDKAKREFLVDNQAELKKLRELYLLKDEEDRTIKPYFFAHLAKEKGFYDTDKKQYLQHHTAMDYLQTCIDTYQKKRHRGLSESELLPFSAIIDDTNFMSSKVKYDQVKRILSYIEETKQVITGIFSNVDLDPGVKYEKYKEVKEACANTIGTTKMSESTMIYLLRLCDDPKYKTYSRTILTSLFGYPNTAFFQVLKNSEKPIEVLMESHEGDIMIYDFHFIKALKG